MTVQKFMPVMALPDGTIELIGASDGKKVEDILADGWTVKAMVSPGPEGFVLLLVEKEEQAEGSWGVKTNVAGW